MSKIICCIITGGHVHDAKIASEIIEKNSMTTLIADKAYHSIKPWKQLEEKHMGICIPPKYDTKVKIEYDKNLYKTRHVI